jgi:GNAT superfamily N-acetyltransferase
MLSLEEVARAEELRQAAGLRMIAPEARDIAGGVMARGVPGLWYNGAVGMGVAQLITPADVAALIDFHSQRGIEPRLELSPFVQPASVRAVADAGFVPRLFENTFFHPLSRGRDFPTAHPAPEGLVIRAVDRDDEDEVRQYAVTCVSGFIPEGQDIPEDHLQPAITTVRNPRVVSAAAWLDGLMVGAGGLDSIFGLSVRPEYRRRGIQQALIAWRLRHAASRGCRIATIGSRPGAATERNVLRMGFTLAYTKVHLTRPAPGLTPNPD